MYRVLLYQQEFGQDFQLGINVPTFFSDQSYRHDVCPRFVYTRGKRRIILWIDFKEASQRELDDKKRYTLELWNNDQWQRLLIETNSKAEIIECISSEGTLDLLVGR